MKTKKWINVALVASLVAIGTASVASAKEGLASRTEVSIMGGIQALNENDTALPDNFINVPAVATLTYHLTPILAIEGEFTWMIPLEQNVNVGPGTAQDLKTPDILAYQANLRANWPISNAAWAPYLAAGAGAVTFLSNTDSNRLPALDQSQTVFAINFGPGLTYGLGSDWALRADARAFVAFPPSDATGFSSAGQADPIWMERGAIGLAYKF